MRESVIERVRSSKKAKVKSGRDDGYERGGVTERGLAHPTKCPCV